MSLLIKNGRIITAVDDYHGDVFIDAERVAVIGKDLSIEADQLIDATGKYVFPGGVDPHTHLDMPFGGTTSADDFETGTLAAAHGGTTTLIDFAIQFKGESTLSALETWHNRTRYNGSTPPSGESYFQVVQRVEARAQTAPTRRCTGPR